MNFFSSKIGCNIVHGADGGESYTEEVYREELIRYQQYGFSHVEFSHVQSLDVPAAKRLRKLSQELGITIWSLHSEHLNDMREEAEYYRIQEHCAEIGEAAICRIWKTEPAIMNVTGGSSSAWRICSKPAECGLPWRPAAKKTWIISSA